MVDSAGDAQADVQARGDGLAGLTDLGAALDPALVAGHAGGSHRGVERLGQGADQVEVAVHAAAAHDDGARLAQGGTGGHGGGLARDEAHGGGLGADGNLEGLSRQGRPLSRGDLGDPGAHGDDRCVAARGDADGGGPGAGQDQLGGTQLGTGGLQGGDVGDAGRAEHDGGPSGQLLAAVVGDDQDRGGLDGADGRHDGVGCGGGQVGGLTQVGGQQAGGSGAGQGR